MHGISVVSAKTEERPIYFEFTKNDIVGRHPTMANLGYDPYPEAKNNDIVRREIIGRELVLRAMLKGPAGSLRLGIAFEHNGHKFALRKVEEHLDVEGGDSTFEVEGTEPLRPIEPMKDLAKLRELLASE